MPRYLYRCDSCGETEEQARKSGDRSVEIACKNRGCEGVTKRDHKAEFSRVRFAEVKGTGNGAYGRSIERRAEENEVKRREFEKNQRKALRQS